MAGKMAAGYIRGIQKNGVSAKNTGAMDRAEVAPKPDGDVFRPAEEL